MNHLRISSKFAPERSHRFYLKTSTANTELQKIAKNNIK